MKKVEERFLEYVKIDTKSDTTTGTTPSTKGQLVLADILAKELKEMGLNDVTISEYGYVYATLEKNCNKNIPTIGFISHMDTAPDYSGKDVNPQIVKHYDGGDIKYISKVAEKITLNDNMIVLFAIKSQDKVNLIFAASKNINNISMSDLLKDAISLIDGKGGGSKFMAQGGGKNFSNLQGAMDYALRKVSII